MSERAYFFHAHDPQACNPVCVLDKVRGHGWLVLTPPPAAHPADSAEALLRKALEGLDEPLQWLVKHYRKAFVEMPRPLYERFEQARAALTAAPAGASDEPRPAGLDEAKALAFIVIRDRQSRDHVERENRWTLPGPLWESLDESQRAGWIALAAEYARLQANEGER